MDIEAQVVGILTAEEISQERARGQAIVNSVQVGAISSNQFVFFAAFDGTRNEGPNVDPVKGVPKRRIFGRIFGVRVTISSRDLRGQSNHSQQHK